MISIVQSPIVSSDHIEMFSFPLLLVQRLDHQHVSRMSELIDLGALKFPRWYAILEKKVNFTK
jgi:hypothetical protein